MKAHRRESGNPLVLLCKEAWRYSLGSRRYVVSSQAMFIAAQLLVLFLNPLLAAKMMDMVVTLMKKGQLSATDFRTLGVLAVLPFVVRVLNWALHGPARILEQLNAFKARVNFRSHMLQGVFALPLEWHTEHHSGDTVDKMEKGANALLDFSSYSFEITYAFLKFFGSFFLLVYFFPASFPVLALFVYLTVKLTVMFDRKLIPQYRELSRAENWAAEGIFDAIANISTVIILRVEHLVYEGLMKRIRNRYELYKHNAILNELKWFSTSMCASLMKASIFLWYFWYYRDNISVISAGTVYLLYRYLEEMTDTFFSFTNLYGQTVRQGARMANAEELSEDFVNQSFTNHVLPPDWTQLEVKGLCFSYHSEEDGDLHLEDISLSAQRGEKIALVGESGGGKTTTLKVMRGLYAPRKLDLTVDGKPIPEGFDGIARAISLVPQNPEIFKASMLENITLNAEYDLETVQRFIDMACFTPVVERLPKGLESSVKEKGVNLSGGEQQRLALARGLLASAEKDIILLDEPTASIDAANEMEIYKRIFEGFADKTVISTIHRLHLLPMFDRICVFERGRIVADGTLEELLENSVAFQELWEKYTVERQEV